MSASAPAVTHPQRCLVPLGVAAVLSTAGPCWGSTPSAVDPTAAAESEYRLGLDFFAASFGVLAPLAPGWRLGGAGGLGFSVGPAWTSIDEFGSAGIADVVRAEVLVSRTLGSHAWLDLGISTALTALNSEGEALVLGAAVVSFVEPLLGWSFLRFGSRVSAGYWLNLDDYYGPVGDPAGFVVVWKPVTAKLVW